MSVCRCPRIDGYVIVSQSCPHHEAARARQALTRDVKVVTIHDAVADELACAWSDYRKDYVNARDMKAAYKAFCAGWKAAREGDQSGPLR